MILANEQVAELLARRKLPALFRDPSGAGASGDRVAGQALRRPRRADRARAGAHVGRRRRRAGSASRPACSEPSSVVAVGRARRSGRSCCVRSTRRATSRRTSATRVSRRRPTATSRRRSGAIPTSSAIAACWRRSGSRRRCPRVGAPSPSWPSTRRRPSGSPRTWNGRADGICAASFLADELRDDPQREHDGEITGLIGPGLFVRFADVFEGFLPSRRLDYGDRFEPNELGTALVGRANGRRFRLGDPIRVVVTEIDAPRGRVTLDLAGREPRDDERPRPGARSRGLAARRAGRRRGGRADDGSTLSRWLRASTRLSPTAGRDTSSRCSSGSRPGSR